MVFSSLTFIFLFLPVLIILYYIVPYKFKNALLLVGSFIFYAYGELKFFFLLVLSVLINYLLAICMDAFSEKSLHRKIVFIGALVYNLGVLFFFKYINFVIENMNYLLGGLSTNSKLPALSLGLPLGLSFYTFQITSYMIDVYRRSQKAERSLFRLSLYLCMFPQLISGPIVKYSDISEQFDKREISLANLEKGLKLFTIGLGLKVLLADKIGILWHDIQTIGFESISTPLAWLGAIGYSLQLYFDFFGYSLMAIGAGRMLGFVLPDNFNHPYISTSVSEFWRRWHMTLGKWFKDYVYIPLGGNRVGTLRLIFNLFIVWALTGLWHGANWNFVLWGLSLFVFIGLEKLILKPYLDRSKILSRIYVCTVMPLTWMVFAISNLSEIRVYFGRLFGILPGIFVNKHDVVKYLGIYHWYFIAGIFLCMPFVWNWYRKYEKNLLVNLMLLILFWYSVYQLSNGINNPFMYFKF